MKITLIKPNIGRREHSLYVDDASMEPLQLAILAALTPEDIDVVMYDDRLEPIPYDEPTDLVAITVETFTARRAYEISEEYKKRNVKVIMGGMHVKLIPEEVKEHCDSIMIGDAEDKWPEMIEDLKKGNLKEEYKCSTVYIPQKRIYPRREIFEGKKYMPISLIQFSRGCKFNCKYCASSIYFEQKHLCREIEEVVQEIKMQKRKLLFFVDDNIVGNKQKAKELFKALIPLKIKWVSQGSIDMLEDEELMKLMVKSGCLGHVIGFESIKPESIDNMQKGVNKKYVKNQYKEAIKKLRKYGLQTWAAFTIGHDTDTIESIKATYEFALKNKFCFSAYNILMPYPGTKLYNELKEENRLLYDGKWWLHEQYRFNYTAFVPKNMTADELTEVGFWCRKNFNSIKSVIYRLFEPRTNMRNPVRLFTYLIYNPVFRKEVFEKQGMTFGCKEKDKNGGKKMKITFILPAIGKKKNQKYLKSWLMEPLTIAVLNSIVPQKYEREFFDDRIEKINYDTDTDVVFITVETYTAKRAYYIAAEFRKRGKKVILGGYHVTLMPEEAENYADAIMINNAGGNIEKLLEDIENNNLQKRYEGGPCIDYKIPDRTIYKKQQKKYLPVSLVETGRGCYHNCEFCSIAKYYKSNYIHREIKDIINEMKQCKHKLFFLVDDSIFSDREFAKELFKEIKKLNIIWTTQITLDIAKDEETLKLMKESGCEMVLIGFESINQDNLKQMNKEWTQRLGERDELIEKIHNVGISIYASFVFGFDYDTEESFKKTLEFCYKHQFFIIAFNHLLTFPNTKTYMTFQKDDRLICDKWWLQPGYTFGTISFTPKQLSPEALRNLCKIYKKKFFAFKSIIQRGRTCLKRTKNPMINFAYWVMNILFHFEVDKRAGIPVGENLEEIKK